MSKIIPIVGYFLAFVSVTFMPLAVGLGFYGIWAENQKALYTSLFMLTCAVVSTVIIFILSEQANRSRKKVLR